MVTINELIVEGHKESIKGYKVDKVAQIAKSLNLNVIST